MAAFERDPSDGLVAFIHVKFQGFELKDITDMQTLYQGLFTAGRRASEECGYTVYPILKLLEEADG